MGADTGNLLGGVAGLEQSGIAQEDPVSVRV